MRTFLRFSMLCLASLLSMSVYAEEIPNDEIWYTASEKLTESSGLHTNAFNTSITSHTFSDGKGVIKFSGNVTSIGNSAFKGCSGLTSITIPNSVTEIGNAAFIQCTNLKTATIGSSLKSIGNQVFEMCRNLTSINIPNSVTSIGSMAFCDCTNLASISIPNSVAIIGGEVFRRCSSLTSITIPSSVTNIGESVFVGCTSLASIIVDSENPCYDSRGNCNALIEKSTNTLISGCKTTVIPNSVTSIGDFAFLWCSGLSSITIPNSVTSIGFQSFYDCTGLITVNLPNSVTNIGEGAFCGCSNLTTINLPSSVTNIGEQAFSLCTSLPAENGLMYVGTYLVGAADKTLYAYTIKEGTKWIGSGAFFGCSNMTYVNIPNSVTTIEGAAFYNCSNLSTITIPNSVISFGTEVFNGCTSLPVEDNVRYADTYLVKAVDRTQSSYTIKEGTKWIDQYAFSNCSSLASIIIPNTVIGIEEEAFYKCTSLKSVSLGNSVTNIGASAFSGCSELTSITIPNTLTSIDFQAFRDCSALTTINIPSSVTSIESGVFSGCTSLPVENGLRYADTYLVEAVDKTITSCNVKNGTVWVGGDAFYNCSNLKSVTIPNSVIGIQTGAFGHLKSLESVSIPKSVKSIEDCAFWECTKLKDVTVEWTENIPNVRNMREPQYSVFTGDDLSNATLHVPAGTKSLYQATDVWKDFGTIEEYVPQFISFDDSNVETICIENWDSNGDGKLSKTEATSVTSLGGVFKNNTTITSFAELSYFTGLTSLSAEEFSGCSALESITIPSSITEIGNYAFQDCVGLTSFTTNVADPGAIALGTEVWKDVDLSVVPLTAPNKESLKKYSKAAQWSAFKYDIPKEVSFDENSDITSKLEELVTEGKRVDFTINRTFYCDGYFNTICLPFSMTAAEIAASPIGGYKELKKFVKADVKGKGKEMNVNVGLSATKEIEAGVPYLMSWHKGANIVNPTFENVLVTVSEGSAISGGEMSCVGILKPTVLDPANENLMFLGDKNLLYWPSDTTPLKAFRAYFTVNKLSMVSIRKDMPAYFVDIDEVTGISEVQDSRSEVQSVKYIENGKVIIEKNGVKYDTMGRVVK